MGNNIPNSVKQEIRERKAQQAENGTRQVKPQGKLRNLINKVFSLFW